MEENTGWPVCQVGERIRLKVGEKQRNSRLKERNKKAAMNSCQTVAYSKDGRKKNGGTGASTYRWQLNIFDRVFVFVSVKIYISFYL